jgi:hypothetical protein
MQPEPAYLTHPHLTLVDPDERLEMRLGASVLLYRRLSLGALAAIERQQALTLAEGNGADGPRQVWLPPAALEAAICAHVLLGWQGVRDPLGGAEVPYAPALAPRLPAGARRALIRRAQKIHPPRGG